MSVVAVSLSLRLVFEDLIVAYYFMALAVSLVLLDVVRGHIRRSTVAWLAAVAVVFCFFGGQAFNEIASGGSLRRLVPLLIVVPALLATLLAVLQGKGRRKLYPLTVAASTLVMWAGHVDTTDHRLVVWLWQVLLVVPGVMLAAGPLLAAMRHGGTQTRPPNVPAVGVHGVSCRAPEVAGQAIGPARPTGCSCSRSPCGYRLVIEGADFGTRRTAQGS